VVVVMSLSDQVKSGIDTKGFERWEPPEMAGQAKPKLQIKNVSSAAKKEQASPITAEQLEAIQSQAYNEGFALGQKEGLADAQRQISEKTAKLDAIMGSLSQPLAEQDDELVKEVVDLSLAVVKQLIRRELKSDPGEIVAVVREAVALLPVGGSTIRLRLNPEDAAIVSDHLPSADGERAWSIIEDPALSRGGCRVSTENSNIDATMETRLAAVIAQLMGGDRDQDQDQDSSST